VQYLGIRATTECWCSNRTLAKSDAMDGCYGWLGPTLQHITEGIIDRVVDATTARLRTTATTWNAVADLEHAARLAATQF
jgi:hypothetical protein